MDELWAFAVRDAEQHVLGITCNRTYGNSPCFTSKTDAWTWYEEQGQPQQAFLIPLQ